MAGVRRAAGGAAAAGAEGLLLPPGPPGAGAWFRGAEFSCLSSFLLFRVSVSSLCLSTVGFRVVSVSIHRRVIPGVLILRSFAGATAVRPESAR